MAQHTNPAVTTSPASRGVEARLPNSGAKSLLAVLLMMFGTSLIPLMDALAKGLVNDGLPALHAAAGRFTSQTIILGVLYILMRAPPSRMSTAIVLERRLAWGKMDVWRGIFIALGTVFFFSSLRVMVLPAATAILLLVPIILVLLAHVFLGEKVRPIQWGVMILSFLSALVIIRPGAGSFGMASILPLLSAFSFAGYFLLTRLSAQTASVVPSQLVVSIFGVLTLLVIIVVLTFIQPGAGWLDLPDTLHVWLVLLSLGLISLISHFAIFFAMRIGTVPLLAPFIYFELVSATLLSAWMFDELPDQWTIIGALGLTLATLTETLYRAQTSKAASDQ